MMEEILPSFLLLDLKMPGKSGHEVLQPIKENRDLRQIPVAVLTSSTLDADMAESYGLGSNHFTTKPEDPAELERQLRTLLKHMSRWSGRRGANRLEAMRAAGTHRMSVVRQLIRWVAVLAVLGGLVAFAQFVGLF
jgi:DNA-binding response OmpR family regulator